MTRFVTTLSVLVWIPFAAPCRAQDPLFVSAASVAVGRGSGDVMLADLDRDGHLDLLTRHLLERRVAVRLGDGRGHFPAAPANLMSFDYQPSAATLGDVNGDEILDLAVTSRDSSNENVHV